MKDVEKKLIKKIIISRTDNIGDVVLTIPMAKILKENFPGASISFIGQQYTKEIINCCEYIDNFINYNDLIKYSTNELVNFLKNYEIDLFIHVFPNKVLANACKKAKIKYRLGTISRLYHLWTCNLLPRVKRKNSNLHEAQLNIKLLSGLINEENYNIDLISSFYGMNKIPKLNEKVKSFLSSTKKNIIIHPRSKGSAREWGLDNFLKLVDRMSLTNKFNIIITGTEEERKSIQSDFLSKVEDKVTDSTGKLSLQELIMLIANSDGLVAASTGPLHIASSLGVNCLGLYIMTRPMHPGRWKPLGEKADYIVFDKNDLSTDSITKIEPQKVYERILSWS